MSSRALLEQARGHLTSSGTVRAVDGGRDALWFDVGNDVCGLDERSLAYRG